MRKGGDVLSEYRRRGVLAVVVFLAALIAAAPAFPEEEIARISQKEMKEMIDKGAGAVIVDNRPGVDYDQQHIKGALSLPWDMDIAAQARKILPKDKLIVTYCDCGPGEADSADVGSQLARAGFKNVKTLADGWSSWLDAGFPVEKGKRK
jgi:rhodanese-related sulfurtransferase